MQLNLPWMLATCHWGILTHFGWNNEWHLIHSSSGIPVTPGNLKNFVNHFCKIESLSPGQNGEQGVKLDTTGRMVLDGGCEDVFLTLACWWWTGFDVGAGRPEVTGDILEPGTTGRMETPEGRDGILAVLEVLVVCGLEAGGLCLPTGGWSLLSITVYFWSVLAEKERVVPILTYKRSFEIFLELKSSLTNLYGNISWNIEKNRVASSWRPDKYGNLVCQRFTVCHLNKILVIIQTCITRVLAHVDFTCCPLDVLDTGGPDDTEL